jgi:tripartite-type tricarboxylate transporter receptor subunit TctC
MRFVLSFLLLFALQANAQPYPSKPVKLVVPFPAGSATDQIARVLGQELQTALGQPFVVDNKPGAQGTIAAEGVAKSPPDGYTLMVYSQTFLANAHLYQKVPYDTLKDFIGITPVTVLIGMIAVHPSMPVRTVKDLIALAKARPGQILYGSAGIGAFQHLSTSTFEHMAGIKMTHVPFKGGAPATVALVGGEIHMILTPVAEVYPYLKSGRLRPIAVSSSKRTSQFPDVPTIGETVKGYDFVSWFAVFAPAGTPRPIIHQLNAELKKAVEDRDVAAKLSAQVLDPMHMTSEEFARQLKVEYDRLRDVVKLSGARIE